MRHRPPLGQHFLRDPHVIQTILKAAELQPSHQVLEIGPGKGVLTRSVIPWVSKLFAVELDQSLAVALPDRLGNPSHVQVIHADILKLDLPLLFPEATPQHPIRLLGNLPYSITSPIFEKLLGWPGWDIGVFLIQREVGERMRSQPGSRTFGVLSLAVQLFADVEKICLVKPGAFVPPPHVMSMVIRLRHKKPVLSEPDIAGFFDLLHGAFAHRRKTLLNSLSLFAQKPKEEVDHWLENNGIDGTRRAETLSLSEYTHLAPAWSIFRR